MARAERVTGVHLWLGATPAAREAGAPEGIRDARFEPQEVRAWVDVARRFVVGERLDTLHTSPVLGGAGGEVMAVARVDAPPTGEPPYLLFVADSGGAGRQVLRATADGLEQLFTALALAAAESGWVPDSVLAARGSGCDDLADTLCTPVQLMPGAKLATPSVAMSGRGVVWAQYDVTEEGRVDPGSIDIIYSDQKALEGSVRRTLGRLRFVPARRQHQPIKQTVIQAFGFDFGGGRP